MCIILEDVLRQEYLINAITDIRLTCTHSAVGITSYAQHKSVQRPPDMQGPWQSTSSREEIW